MKQSGEAACCRDVIWPVLDWHLRMLNVMSPTGRPPGEAAMLSLTNQLSSQSLTWHGEKH